MGVAGSVRANEAWQCYLVPQTLTSLGPMVLLRRAASGVEVVIQVTLV